MATLATVHHKLTPQGLTPPGLNQQVPEREAQPRKSGAPVPLRAYANEDVYFFVKRIDNRRLVRQADPQARQTCWKMIASVGVAAGLIIGVLLPGAYTLMAGYRIQTLRQESALLAAERATLELREVQLLSPARMEELARQQQFIDPEPEKVVYLESQVGSSVAMNQSGGNK